MAERSSSLNLTFSPMMQENPGVWDDEQSPFTISQRTKDFPLLLFPEHHDQGIHADSHVVPDADDVYEPHHPHDDYSQVAPRIARKINLFDLEKLPVLDDDDDALIYPMINSKTNASVPEAAEIKDLVVPHHLEHCELLDSDHPHTKPIKHANEGEAALVPSLSVCSNDPHTATTQHPDQDQDQDQVQSVREQALAEKIGASRIRTPAKRKYARARTTEKQRVKISRKMRTLQGLLPNLTDKADKASILDEAIVYVKALQLQLQMMSMPPMHLSYLPTTPAATPAFPMLGFPPFVPLPAPLLVPHPSISLSTSINSNLSSHLLKHHQR